jgi:hypothetical protein
VGSPDSHGVSRAPCYSGTSAITEGSRFRVQDYHLLRFRFPADSACDAFVTPYRCPQPHPDCSEWFGLFRVRSPLLTESQLISFPTGTEMCQFPAFASIGLCIQPMMTQITLGRVSPFGHPGINGCSTPAPGLSQPATSFIASRRLDILHTPLVT